MKFVVEALLENVFVPEPENETAAKSVEALFIVPAIACAAVLEKVTVPELSVKEPFCV